MKYLDKTVSIYQSVADNKGSATTLRTFLLSEKYRKEVEHIRTISDKEQRNELKKKLPLVTVSGVFEPTRSSNNLKEHTGLICIDIDGSDNIHIKNFSELKTQLSNIKEVLFCAVSVSGNGYFAIIPIKNPNNHREHFIAMQEDFKSLGINIDIACKDVTRLRGYSYDPQPYINEDAEIYNRVFVPEKKYYVPQCDQANDNISKIVNIACRNRIDITGGYHDWFSLGCALSSELGEAGRNHFHAISSISDKYKYAECDKKYNECLKTNRIGIGTFFSIAKDYGIMFKDK